MDPVPEVAPMALEVTFPMFTAPDDTWMPVHAAAPWLLQAKFLITFPCTLVAVEVPTVRLMA